MLKLTTDKHEASRGLSATAELLVLEKVVPVLLLYQLIRKHLGSKSLDSVVFTETTNFLMKFTYKSSSLISWLVIISSSFLTEGASKWVLFPRPTTVKTILLFDRKKGT